jgi:hypothetical protein
MVDWLYYVLLALVLLTGLLLNLFGLPGNWLMLLAVAGYAWLTGWRYVGWISLVVLLVVAVAAEVVEFFAAGAGAKRRAGLSGAPSARCSGDWSAGSRSPGSCRSRSSARWSG